jgi:hypothetical protein
MVKGIAGLLTEVQSARGAVSRASTGGPYVALIEVPVS